MVQLTDAQLLQIVQSAYSRLAAELVEPILDFMTVARALVGGDSDKVLVMLVISVRTKRHPDFAKLTREQMDAGAVPVLPSMGVNVSSIADSTGMPKETVRRKVAELIDEGVLTRIGNDVRYTAKGYIAIARRATPWRRSPFAITA